MIEPNHTIHLNAQDLPATGGDGAVPEWIHLLPTASGAVLTGDRRGPYNVIDARAIIAASLQGEAQLPIDENHATDLAAPKGLPAPARGWIVEMQARADGVWGRVEWSDEGRALVASRAYRGISPVIDVERGSRAIRRILRASLINKPNLRGLVALNQEEDMPPFHETVAGLLGLDPSAAEGDIEAAITALKDGAGQTELQSQLAEIGTVLGVEDGGDILAAAKNAASGDVTIITELQSEISSLTTKMNKMATDRARERAELFVDKAIRELRGGVSNNRDTFISMHMENPERTEELINGFQTFGPSGIPTTPPETTTTTELNAEQLSSQAVQYQAQQREAGIELSMSAAVRAVQEGKA